MLNNSELRYRLLQVMTLCLALPRLLLGVEFEVAAVRMVAAAVVVAVEVVVVAGKTGQVQDW